MKPSSVHLSSAYLAPVRYYSKLCEYSEVYLETAENYQKQTYRNRCVIAGANGPLVLSIPIVKPDTLKCLTRDIRISDHGHWRHLHWNALLSSYNLSPFFEYYEDDFAPFYEHKYEFLFDFNEALLYKVCELIDLTPVIHHTDRYEKDVPADFRDLISSKRQAEDLSFRQNIYYQVFKDKNGFLPDLSIVDLLFNMGPESILVLRNSFGKPCFGMKDRSMI